MEDQLVRESVEKEIVVPKLVTPGLVEVYKRQWSLFLDEKIHDVIY